MSRQSPSTLSVTGVAEPVRLDRYLVEQGLARTRSQAKGWIDGGYVRVDGLVRKAGFLLHGGEKLEVVPAPRPDATPGAEDIPLTLLYQDEDVVALDKPPGLVVHPAPGAWSGTLVNALLFHGIVPAGATDRPGIVHRLDKETSGVLLVARHGQAHEALARQFQERSVEKVYLAILIGTPARREGTIDWSIGRHPRERKRMSVRSPRGRLARTRYRVLESLGPVSLVEARPETGRTHQIRVHFAALGHPVLADPLYGARSGRALPAASVARTLGRQALHASAITFRHPRTNVRLVVEAPIPADLGELLERLREGSR